MSEQIAFSTAGTQEHSVDYLDQDMTGRDGTSFYLDDIAKTPLLNAEKEVELAKTIEAGLYAEQLLKAERVGRKNGGAPLTASREELEWLVEEGEQARNEFLTSNLRLVASIAKKYHLSQMPYLDRIQEGNLGLIRAVEKFDFTKGYKFSTYATWWVRQAIVRGIAQKARVVRLPVHVVEDITQLFGARRVLERELGREPTPEELAEELEIKTDRVIDLLTWAKETMSLDAPLDEESDATFGDLIGSDIVAEPEETTLNKILRERLRELVNQLQERDADIMRARFGLINGEGMGLAKIAEAYGLSHERVRQIIRVSTEKLIKLANGETIEQPKAKPEPKLGVRAQQKKDLDEKVALHKGEMDQADVEIIEAYTRSRSFGEAALSMCMSDRTFKKRYETAYAKLNSLS